MLVGPAVLRVCIRHFPMLRFARESRTILDKCWGGIGDAESKRVRMTLRVCETAPGWRELESRFVRHRQLDQRYRRDIDELIRDSETASAIMKTDYNDRSEGRPHDSLPVV